MRSHALNVERTLTQFVVRTSPLDLSLVIQRKY